MRTGVVRSFDVERGLGEVADADGTVYPLHCTQIADGSRRIDPGTPVTFSVLAKLGRYEATDVRPA